MEKKDRHTYTYDGPVYIFSDCVNPHWRGKTTATSEAKAKSNLIYQWKKEHKMSPTAKVTLPGKINFIS